MKKTFKSGFSLIELLVTLLIVTILLSVSIPTFTQLLRQIKKENTLDILNASIYNAKNYAVNNRTAVFLSVNNKGTTTEWQSLKVYTNDKILLSNDDFDGISIRTDSGIKFNFNGQVTDLSNKPIINKTFCIDSSITNSTKYILSINYLGKTTFEEKNACK